MLHKLQGNGCVIESAFAAVFGKEGVDSGDGLLSAFFESLGVGGLVFAVLLHVVFIAESFTGSWFGAIFSGAGVHLGLLGVT